MSAYEREEKHISDEIEKIENKINKATNSALKNVRLGMTPSEVRRVCGKPRSRDECGFDLLYYNYGNVWVMFQSNVVVSVFYAKYYEGACWYDTGRYRARNLIW